MKDRKRIQITDLPNRWQSLTIFGYPQVMICGMDMWRSVGGPLSTEVEVIEDGEIKNLLFKVHDYLEWLSKNP